MPKEVLTSHEVARLLQSLNDPIPLKVNTDMDTFFKGHNEEQKEMKEMISQEEIDALLGGSPANENENEDDAMDTMHMAMASYIHDAKISMVKSMKIANKVVQDLLMATQDMALDNNVTSVDERKVQTVLGKYYTFLNECHAELKHLDNLTSEVYKLYHSKNDLSGIIGGSSNENQAD